MARQEPARTPHPTAGRWRERAFSTGEAARYCYVSADTIVNWVRSGALQAQRTIGGQYRILADDLRAFLSTHGMSTELLDAELSSRPYCWEFHRKDAVDPRCLRCLVYRSGALNCFELDAMTRNDDRLLPDCAACEYHRCYATEGADAV